MQFEGPEDIEYMDTSIAFGVTRSPEVTKNISSAYSNSRLRFLGGVQLFGGVSCRASFMGKEGNIKEYRHISVETNNDES